MGEGLPVKPGSGVQVMSKFTEGVTPPPLPPQPIIKAAIEALLVKAIRLSFFIFIFHPPVGDTKNLRFAM
jgi:hypothetical protein